MSKRSIATSNEEPSTKRKKVEDPPFPSDSSSSDDDSSVSSSSSLYGTNSSHEDDDDDSGSLSTTSSDDDAEVEALGEDDLLVACKTTLTDVVIDKPVWFGPHDAISIIRVSCKRGPLKEVNDWNKERKDYSVKLNTIKTGKSVRKVKKPFGSINQELYNKSFTIKNKVCNYEGLLVNAILENNETHELFMIDNQLFDYWIDDVCEKRFNDNCTEEDDDAEEEHVS
jgi:hypothetical protein